MHTKDVYVNMRYFSLTLVGVGLLGGLAFGTGGCGLQGGKSLSSTPRFVEQRVPVKLAKVGTDTVLFSTSKMGVMTPNRQVQLNFKTSGQLKEWFVEEDSRVEMGARVAVIDDLMLKANVEKASLAVDRLGSELRRLAPLVEKRMIPQPKYDELETRHMTAQTELKVAKAALKWSAVTAPFSGILLKKLAVEGSFVAPGMPIAILIETETLKSELDFSDAEVRNIPLGKEVDVFCDTYPDDLFRGKVTRILPKLDLNTRMTKVEMLVSNSGRRLKPGMMIRTTIVTDRMENVVSIPVDALAWQEKRAFVYTVDGEKAKRQELKLGKFYKDRVVILDGLAVGTEIVVAGQAFLTDGVKVNVVK